MKHTQRASPNEVRPVKPGSSPVSPVANFALL